MSGGHFNYSQNRISDIIDSINEIIKANKELNYSEDTIQKFKTGIIFLKIAQVYAQRIDWLISGDDSEDTFHERLKEELEEDLKDNVIYS